MFCVVRVAILKHLMYLRLMILGHAFVSFQAIMVVNNHRQFLFAKNNFRLFLDQDKC